jgi:Cytochrome C oxidase, cbb3-type, subunit III
MDPAPTLRWLAAHVTVGAALASPAFAADASPTRAPAAVYDAACAACHGADGRGAPRSTVGFEVPLPDFTECRSWPREADADWFAITHDGGPARAFDRLMPAFGTALTAAEMNAAIVHVRRFCRDAAWPRGELNLPRPLVTEKAFPEDEVVTAIDLTTEGSGDTLTKVIFEQRIGSRTQWEAVVPIPAHESAGDWSGGVGDLALAMKRVIHHSAQSRILSVIGELILPTGSEATGTGGGVTVFEPSLVFGQVLPGESFVQLQAGVGLSANRTKTANEVLWRAAVGKSFSQGRFGRAWSPMLEALAARELGSGHATEWDLVPQVQVTLSRRHHIRLDVGMRVPVTEPGPRPTRFVSYLLWDWFDGGLLDGW